MVTTEIKPRIRREYYRLIIGDRSMDVDDLWSFGNMSKVGHALDRLNPIPTRQELDTLCDLLKKFLPPAHLTVVKHHVRRFGSL